MAKILSISLILLAIIAVTYGRSTGYKVDQFEFTNEDKTYERKDESVNIGLNSNSEADNTSEGNTGDDSTDEGNTSEDNTGEGNTGEDNTGDDNTGEGDMDEDNTYGDKNLQGGEILEKLSDYTVVYPRQYSGNKSNKQINTIIDEELGAHLHKVSFEFEKSGDDYLVLDLDINKDLISSKFTQSLYGNDGLQNMVTTEKDLHHCNYHGKVRGVEDSDVTLSTCNGLRGFIDYNDNFYYIEPISDNHVTDGHVLYKPTDHQHYNHPHGGASTCGVESSATNQTSPTSDDFMELRRSRRKRSASANQKYFIETLIVMDKENYDRFKTPEERQNHVKEIINLVDGYYKPLNFRVVLSHIEFWEKENRAVMDTNANTALNVFMEYRSKQLADDKDKWRDTDVSHLLYGRNFDGTTIGMAPVSTMCGYESGSVNQDLGSPLRVAPTVAHEMGHNLGIHHDTSSCSCKDGTDCIMDRYLGFRQQKSWSQCSVEYLQEGLSIGLGSCLMNVPNAGTLYGGPVCGNEIIERGEECDCGSPTDCTSKCCNATTCLLQPQAQCDSGECCQDCKFQPSGTMCRSTDGNECDLPEFCSGATPFCPGNVFREDGTSCKVSVNTSQTEICHEGICLTHDLQCKLIWGKDAWNGDDLCYTHVNKRGNANGNCGKNNDGSFRRCQAADVKCGKLHCDGGSRHPVLKGLYTKYKYFITSFFGEVQYKCKTIASDIKKITESQDFDDIGMVQEGTGCGENKVCRDNKCTHIEVLNCTTKCNNRGVCNNKGNCHCDPEWSPPYCLKKGRGGSIDSGPVSVKGTTPEPTTPEPTTPEPTLTDEERIEQCGFINSKEDESITASSVLYLPYYGPQHSRLNTESGEGGWHPHTNEGSWIELNLGKDEEVTAVATQGGWKYELWTKTYSVSYKSSTSSIFSDVKNQSGTKQVFNGNTDRNTVVINDFTPPLTAQFIRIHPLSWHGWPALRFDLLSC